MGRSLPRGFVAAAACLTQLCGRMHGRSSERTGAVLRQQVTFSEWNMDR